MLNEYWTWMYHLSENSACGSWASRVDISNEKGKADFDRGGDLLEVDVIDSRKSEHAPKGLQIVAADIPVFDIVARSESGAGGTGNFVIIEDRVVFVRGLDFFQSELEADKDK